MVGLYLAGRPVTWNSHVSVLSIIVTIRDSRWTGHGYMTRALVRPSSIIHRPPFINICQTHTRNYAMPALRRCQGSPTPPVGRQSTVVHRSSPSIVRVCVMRAVQAVMRINYRCGANWIYIFFVIHTFTMTLKGRWNQQLTDKNRIQRRYR